jgi:hypothetical protein
MAGDYHGIGLRHPKRGAVSSPRENARGSSKNFLSAAIRPFRVMHIAACHIHPDE